MEGKLSQAEDYLNRNKDKFQSDQKYNEAQNRWSLSGSSLENDIFASNVIKGPGFNLNILGKPVDGDELTTTPLSGAAAGMQFMLRRAQDFAAASKTLVSATVSNKGTADITATSGKIVSSDNPPVLDKVFTNNIISIYRPYKIIL